ncbi:MAG: glycine/sarcosine/betaine reductase selenoprotein B family protein [Pyrinomonadaceae bacterium]
MDIIENIDDWREGYLRWRRTSEARNEDLGGRYPYVENRRAPFKALGRALPMLSLGLVTSAGAHVDGSEPFDTARFGGDVSFREIPVQVGTGDLAWSARGYDPAAVREDMNAQVPVQRLSEFEGNGIIGRLCPVFWSFCGYIPNAGRLADESLPQLVERVKRYGVQAALLVPASELCHQSMALAARALEASGVATMMLAVDRPSCELVRPPRAAYYKGELGRVAGQPNWPQHQRRILDEALRLLEPFDQPGVRNLTVELETEVEIERGER